MSQAGPRPECDPRRCTGERSRLPKERRLPLGWPALLVSLSVHGAILAGVSFALSFGQGNAGVDGMDQTDAAEVAAPVFQARRAEPSESVIIKPHQAKAFLPAKSAKLVAATSEAEILLPEWEMKSSREITAPVQRPKPEPAKPLTQANALTNGTAERTMRKASGSGAGGGRGSAARGTPPPQIVSSYAPTYPASARRAGVEGTATVRVSVSTKGRVLDCRIFRSAGDESLDAAALKAVKSWHFTPAQADATEVLVRVTFRLG